MKKVLLLLLFSIVLYACRDNIKQNDASNLNFIQDSIGMFQYNIKDTISELYISHQECTECLDAWLDSGHLFISETIHKKLLGIYNKRGSESLPNGRDLRLVGEEKIDEKLFGNSENFMDLWHNKYVITGKAIDVSEGDYGIVFRVDSYKKIGVRN